MPNPQIGKGAAVSKGLHKYKFALYLAGVSDAYASYPTDKLAVGSEPSGTWRRTGRLQEDLIQWNVQDAQKLEGRAGFSKKLQWEVIKQAETLKFTAPIDEFDPQVWAGLQDQNATPLAGAGTTGSQFIYVSGQLFYCKALLIGLDEKNTTQIHFYSGNASILFKPTTAADHDGLEAVVTLYDVSDSETLRVRFWD